MPNGALAGIQHSDGTQEKDPEQFSSNWRNSEHAEIPRPSDPKRVLYGTYTLGEGILAAASEQPPHVSIAYSAHTFSVGELPLLYMCPGSVSGAVVRSLGPILWRTLQGPSLSSVVDTSSRASTLH